MSATATLEAIIRARDALIRNCPQPEQLAAYVDRGLGLHERSLIEAHVSICPVCARVIANAVRTLEETTGGTHE